MIKRIVWFQLFLEKQKIILKPVKALSVLCALLCINTLRKSHVCDHEEPIKDKIILTNETLGNLIKILQFKTVSYEDESKIDYRKGPSTSLIAAVTCGK